MAELKPCPKCGSDMLANAKAIKITTPRFLWRLYMRWGITCINCGYWRHSERAWNRRAEDGNK